MRGWGPLEHRRPPFPDRHSTVGRASLAGVSKGQQDAGKCEEGAGGEGIPGGGGTEEGGWRGHQHGRQAPPGKEENLRGQKGPEQQPEFHGDAADLERKGQPGSCSRPGLLSPGKAMGSAVQQRPVGCPPETPVSGGLQAGLS